MNQNRSPLIPAAVVGLTVLYLAICAWPHGDPANGFHLREFGRLPTAQGGRVMPLDTFARTSLMAYNHRQTFQQPKEGGREDDTETRPAIQFLLDTMVSPPPPVEEGRAAPEVVQLVKMLNVLFKEDRPAYRLRIFRIDNDEVLSTVGLEKRPGFRYAFAEINAAPNYQNFVQRAQTLIKANNPKARTMTDNKVVELYHNLSSFFGITTLQGPLMVPLDRTGEEWDAVGPALVQGWQNKQIDPTTQHLLQMLMAYHEGEPAKFNASLTKAHEHLTKEVPGVLSTVGLEAYFNEFAPFYHCAVLYGLLFVVIAVGWLTRSEEMRSAAYWSVAVIFLVHTWALLCRMYIMGRPPVTNLYSSAVFIGWGCVLTCLFVEWFYRNGVALAVGVTTGGLSLLVAHLLGMSGDTMEVLQAVLDTNFWLATHVTCITFGYTAAFVAGFMGLAYILLGIFTPKLAGDGAANLARMTYGVLCFAMFLSFTGTVLGGIWADQSWGRFWGWDPKENGALLIVLWVAMILHARWAGMIKARGVAVLAVAGNMVTAWSWFGTNLLGIGLHSYGFMQGAFLGLVAFDATMLTVIGLGLAIPQERWRSFQRLPQDTPPPPLAPRPAALATSGK